MNLPNLLRRFDYKPSRVFWACLVIIFWQVLLLTNENSIPTDYQQFAATGLDLREGRHYFYFYENFGVFPVAIRGVPEELPAHTDPQDVLKKLGSRLRNDTLSLTNWGRLGDYGRVYLFKPSVWLGHPPENASVRPTHIFLFLMAILLLLLAFNRQKRFWQGLLFCVLLGSSSFQLCEAYLNENVMSLPLTVAIFCLLLNLPFFETEKKFQKSDLLRALITGALLATFHQVRSESAFIGISLIPLYLLCRRISLARRTALLLTLAASYILVTNFWTIHFKNMQASAIVFVKEHGGIPFSSSAIMHHPLWHSIFCGLGDYGGDRGYAWNDAVAYQYALPILQKEVDPALTIFQSYLVDRNNLGAAYPEKPEGTLFYDQILKKKILGDIQASPAWYAKIIGRRMLAIMNYAQAIELNLVWLHLRLAIGLWPLFLLLAIFVWKKMWFELKGTLFFLPMSLLPLIVYSGRGNTYYQIAHLVAIALFCASGISFLAEKLQQHRRNKEANARTPRS